MSTDDSNTPSPRQDSSLIAGNASQEVKDFLCHVFLEVMTNGTDGSGFALSTGRRLKVREISYVSKAEEPSRKEGRVVFEITVDQGLGDVLRIVNRTITVGARAMTAHCEVCQAVPASTHRRLTCGVDLERDTQAASGHRTTYKDAAIGESTVNEYILLASTRGPLVHL
ncbi:hypothetical protein HWV62_32181 [Athelia sp. TMB]|nr:hypothetical protein HWV62_32181 [Athelia sp. TMB]